ncbi:MAG: clostripain-related cysteine peptidase [Massilibacteroides sp.]|nr:clostripain-related cysteine peptidase [Massilibacteroides sp.]MDD3062201.1 clostripain-related cysteine peptidase [Massilibacteroides sp.]MDD4114427.1 clostripain-related cysteine peptidase [Massilibacteroides sp.]MDD4659719.1 clostripain-related cysteine peptidase [Massilibacteroides sp.]
MNWKGVALLLILVLTGCMKDDKPDDIAMRTILVYMVGDNSLSSFTYKNLQSIVEGAEHSSIETCNLLVYIDALDAAPKLYKIEKNSKGKADSVLVVTYKEQNSVDEEVMRSVIETVYSAYPAEEKGLFLWSHGTAWLPSDITNYLKSFGQDGAADMEMTDLKDALPGRYDYIVFDACYMASVEVVYELKDKADYIIGSSTEIIGDGFPYSDIIPILLSGQSLEERLISASTFFYNHYDHLVGYNRTGNISLVRTAYLNDLATTCRQILYGTYEEERMIDPSKFGLDLQALEYLTYPYTDSYLYDFGDFLSQFEENGKISLDETVLYKATTPTAYFDGPKTAMEIQTYSGLSVYIPQKRHAAMNEWYRCLAWYKAVYE